MRVVNDRVRHFIRSVAYVNNVRPPAPLYYYWGGGPGRVYPSGPSAGQAWDTLGKPWVKAVYALTEHGPLTAGEGFTLPPPPPGVDCSGWQGVLEIVWSWAEARPMASWAKVVPSAETIRTKCVGVTLDESQPGDLYFYGETRATHVTCGLGNLYVCGSNGGGSATFGDDVGARVEVVRNYRGSDLRWAGRLL